MSDHLQIIGTLYNQLLQQDVKEYEQESRTRRLRRLDDAVTETMAKELNNPDKDVLATSKEALTTFGALNEFLVQQGLAAFGSHERLIKAKAFFDADPGQLKEYFGMYREARLEAWAFVDGDQTRKPAG